MKKYLLLIIVLVVATSFFSCQRESNNLIGSFKVIDKEKKYNYGYVHLCSPAGDTVKVYAPCEQFLNIKKGDVRLVGVKVNKHRLLFLGDNLKKGVVGPCVIVNKESSLGNFKFQLLTRGEDYISAEVPVKTYYNSSLGDTVIVKMKNKNKSYSFYVK